MKRLFQSLALTVVIAPCLHCSGGCSGSPPITVRDTDRNVLNVSQYDLDYPTEQLRIAVRDATVAGAAKDALELEGDSLQHVVDAAAAYAIGTSTQFNVVGEESDPDMIVEPSLLSADVSSDFKGKGVFGDLFGETDSEVVVKSLTVHVSLTFNNVDGSQKLSAGGASATTNSVFSVWVKGVEDEGEGSEVVFESGSIMQLLQDAFKGAIMVANRRFDGN